MLLNFTVLLPPERGLTRILHPANSQADHAVNELCETRPWNAYPAQAKRTESPVQIVRVVLLADHTRGDAMDGTVGGITQFIVIVAANKGMDRY